MRLGLFVLAITPLSAHVVSMSTGEARIDGPLMTFELRMPLYEMQHTPNPERAFLDHVRFRGAHRVWAECRQEEDAYVCRSRYEFPVPFDTLEVECLLPDVTVPNHIHLLRAVKGEFSDQAVFDRSFRRAELRFRPPSPGEVAMREFAGGWWRAFSSFAGLLFLAAIAMAARSRRELAAMIAMFIAGEAIAFLAGARLPVALSGAFIEAAKALSVAYLAVEILLLPAAGGRWAVVGLLGVLHGLHFAGLPGFSLLGGAIAQLVPLAILLAIRPWYSRRQKAIAAIVLTLSALWFVVQLTG